MECPCCSSLLQVTAYLCPDCGIHLQGRFMTPRLARLSAEQQRLAEQFLLAGGNLKTLSEQLDISYPTLRKRVDALIADLKSAFEQDQVTITALLDQVEAGALKAEEAARLIRELNSNA